MPQQRKNVILGSLIGLILIVVAACSPNQLQKLEEYKAKADQAIPRLREQVTDAQNRLTTMPSEAPGRDELVRILKDAQEKLVTLQGYSTDVDKVLADVKAGKLTPEGSLAVLRKIPVIGQYADLASMLYGVGVTLGGLFIIKKKQETAQTIIDAWHAEEPAGPSPALHAVSEQTGLTVSE